MLYKQLILHLTYYLIMGFTLVNVSIFENLVDILNCFK